MAVAGSFERSSGPTPSASRTRMAYTPPKIPRGAPNLGLVGFLRAMSRNPIAAIPSTAYVEPYALSKATGAAMIADPEILEQILVKRVGDFPKSEIDDRVLRPAFGDSLLTASGETWRWKRRLVAPAFAPTAMAPLAPVMAAPFERFAEAWASGAVENPVDVALAMREATLAVIAETLFEDPAELDSGAIVQAIEAFLEPISWVVALAALKAPRWTPHPGRGRIRRAAAAMRASVAKTVAHRRGMAAKDDLFGRLMAASDPETGRPLTDEDLVDLILTLVAAGHDTSANTLTWALFLLAEQTDLQAELAAEAAIGSGPADWPKIDAALKETMRLFPAAPMMGRRTTRPERFGTLELAAGTMILIPIYALHRHEALWERPDQFDPARFLGAQPPRTQFMPFGAGPRICVGASFAMQEMALGLAAMLRSARFGVCDETVCDPVHQVTLRPRGPLYLTVRAR